MAPKQSFLRMLYVQQDAGGQMPQIKRSTLRAFNAVPVPAAQQGTAGAAAAAPLFGDAPVNQFWAGPSVGVASPPGFRALDPADFNSLLIPLPVFGSIAANRVLAGPASGSAATPSFRALVADDLPDISAGPLNYLANGGFRFFQRTQDSADTTVTADGYGADRWRMCRENAGLAYQRGGPSFTAPLNGGYFGYFRKKTANGRIFVSQILEAKDTYALHGREVTFQAKLSCGASGANYRMAILQLKAAGTADTIPGTLVTAWGTTDLTFGANVEIITASSQKAVTTSFVQHSVTVTVPTDCHNLICAVWSEAALAFGTGDYLAMGDAGLFDGGVAVNWLPVPVSVDLLMCQRYYEKSYDLSTIPASSTSAGGHHLIVGVDAAAEKYTSVPFKASKRVVPTVTTYDLAGNSGKGSTFTAALVQTDNVAVGDKVVGESSFRCHFGNASHAGYIFQWTAEAEL